MMISLSSWEYFDVRELVSISAALLQISQVGKVPLLLVNLHFFFLYKSTQAVLNVSRCATTLRSVFSFVQVVWYSWNNWLKVSNGRIRKSSSPSFGDALPCKLDHHSIKRWAFSNLILLRTSLGAFLVFSNSSNFSSDSASLPAITLCEIVRLIRFHSDEYGWPMIFRYDASHTLAPESFATVNTKVIESVGTKLR